jgi:hypothetical protein
LAHDCVACVRFRLGVAVIEFGFGLLIAGAVALVGCTAKVEGGGPKTGSTAEHESDAGTPRMSAVNPQKQLKDLSSDEALALCRDDVAYFEQHISRDVLRKYSCMAAGVNAAADTIGTDEEKWAACQRGYDSCFTSAGEANVLDDCTKTAPRMKTCDATVAEVNQCIIDTANHIKTYASQKPCGNTPPDREGIPLPATCIALEKRCPSLRG